jgi:peptidoglycan hydrolase CwlO-like protein
MRRTPDRHCRRRIGVVAVTALAAFAVVVTWLASPATAPAAKPDEGGSFTIVKVGSGRSLKELQQEAGRVRESMDRLKAQIGTISAERAATRAELEQVGGELVETRVGLARTQALFEAQSALVSGNMSALYKAGDGTWLDVLVQSGSFSDLEAQVRLLRRVMDEDQKARLELARLAASVEDLEADLTERLDRTRALEARLEAQQGTLADALAERRVLLEGLTARIEQLLVAQLPTGLEKAPKGGYNQLTWARALLKSLGAPQTTQNLAAIVAWELAEGGHWNNVAHYNPLNTTWSMPGATSMNSVGVKAYVSWEQGFKATLNTLHNGLYGGILRALRAGDDAQAVADAVADSPWGTHAFTVR